MVIKKIQCPQCNAAMEIDVVDGKTNTSVVCPSCKSQGVFRMHKQHVSSEEFNGAHVLEACT